MRRRCFKTVALQSLGCKALADFVSWYAHSGHPWAMPATALHGETLRTLFLVPTVNDAVSSMAHSFRVHTQSVAESDAGALQLAMSLGPDAEAAVTTSRNIPAPEDHVRPALLDGAVAALEALDAWQEVRQRRRELDAARDALLQRRAGVEAALRKLPPQIQEVRRRLHAHRTQRAARHAPMAGWHVSRSANCALSARCRQRAWPPARLWTGARACRLWTELQSCCTP